MIRQLIVSTKKKKEEKKEETADRIRGIGRRGVNDVVVISMMHRCIGGGEASGKQQLLLKHQCLGGGAADLLLPHPRCQEGGGMILQVPRGWVVVGPREGGGGGRDGGEHLLEEVVVRGGRIEVRGRVQHVVKELVVIRVRFWIGVSHGEDATEIEVMGISCRGEILKEHDKFPTHNMSPFSSYSHYI